MGKSLCLSQTKPSSIETREGRGIINCNLVLKKSSFNLLRSNSNQALNYFRFKAPISSLSSLKCRMLPWREIFQTKLWTQFMNIRRKIRRILKILRGMTQKRCLFLRENFHNLPSQNLEAISHLLLTAPAQVGWMSRNSMNWI